MAERTCAACDCQLDTDVIHVKIGGRTVEVCCEDCALAGETCATGAAAPGEIFDAQAFLQPLSPEHISFEWTSFTRMRLAQVDP
jgi:hypothetical protein